MKLEDLSSTELLDLYTLFVEVDRYDKYSTPALYLRWYDAGVTKPLIKEELLKRLS